MVLYISPKPVSSRKPNLALPAWTLKDAKSKGQPSWVSKFRV